MHKSDTNNAKAVFRTRRQTKRDSWQTCSPLLQNSAYTPCHRSPGLGSRGPLSRSGLHPILGSNQSSCYGRDSLGLCPCLHYCHLLYDWCPGSGNIFWYRRVCPPILHLPASRLIANRYAAVIIMFLGNINQSGPA